MLPQQTAHNRLGTIIDHVEGKKPHPIRYTRGQCPVRVRCKRRQINQRRWQIRLRGQMAQKIRLCHRRGRMPRHHGMAVKAKDALGRPCKQVTKGLIPPHLRCSRDNGHCMGRAMRKANLNRPPDTAKLRRRIEGRTKLVMQDFRPQSL